MEVKEVLCFLILITCYFAPFVVLTFGTIYCIEKILDAIFIATGGRVIKFKRSTLHNMANGVIIKDHWIP